jgi:5-methylcytosine-specific restriction endonuclease McrA
MSKDANTSGPSPASKRLIGIADELRSRALRLQTDAPQPDSPNKRPNQSERLAKEFAEGGRLLLEAVEAGAFANDSQMGDLISECRNRVEHKEEKSFRDALAHSRLELFLAFEQQWLPQQRPNMVKELAGGGYSIHHYERYAKVMVFLAQIVEDALEATDTREEEGLTLSQSKRRSLSPDDEAELFEKCRRRCCVCFVLENNDSQQDGHLAHLDHNHSNGHPDNFVFLCSRHHNIYDSRMSQAKNMTEREVRLYQQKLHQAVERGEVPPSPEATVLKFPPQQTGPVTIAGNGNVVAGGNVNYVVNMPRAKRGKRPSATRPPIIPGTVSEDPRMVGYLNYLVRRYEKFKKWDCDISGQRMGYGVIRIAYTRDIKYELIHTPKESFEAGSQFLQRRIENTRLGRTKRGQKLYDHFDEFDEQTSNAEGLPQ